MWTFNRDFTNFFEVCKRLKFPSELWTYLRSRRQILVIVTKETLKRKKKYTILMLVLQLKVSYNEGAARLSFASYNSTTLVFSLVKDENYIFTACARCY